MEGEKKFSCCLLNPCLAEIKSHRIFITLQGYQRQNSYVAKADFHHLQQADVYLSGLFLYIYKLFIHSSLLSFIIEHRSILIFGLIMHFPVQAESTALFKSVGDKMQADYLTVAIKEPCELLCLLQVPS